MPRPAGRGWRVAISGKAPGVGPTLQNIRSQFAWAVGTQWRRFEPKYLSLSCMKKDLAAKQKSPANSPAPFQSFHSHEKTNPRSPMHRSTV